MELEQFEKTFYVKAFLAGHSIVTIERLLAFDNMGRVYIRDLLGHVNVSTTEIYARADSEMKRVVLEKAYVDVVADDIPTWNDDKDLLSWLQNFCRSQNIMLSHIRRKVSKWLR
jgi:hypothetical protein